VASQVTPVSALTLFLRCIDAARSLCNMASIHRVVFNELAASRLTNGCGRIAYLREST